MKMSLLVNRVCMWVTVGVLAILGAGCQALRGDKADGAFTVVQLSDPQVGFKDYAAELGRFQQAVKQINEIKPDFIVVCGDLVNKPDDKSFSDFKTAAARLKMRMYCAPGNHDLSNTPTAATLANWRKHMGRDYFSFEHKGMVFVVANTQLWKAHVAGESEKHDAWFKETLHAAAARHKPVVVVCHYPPYEEKPDEPDAYFNLAPEKRQELLKLYQETGVVAVLVGHAHKVLLHNYEGIPIIGSETTSENFDKRPYGFHVWHFGRSRTPDHAFVPLEHQ